MKHNTNTTNKKSTKVNNKDKESVAAANAARVIARRTPSGLDREIVLHSVLLVSVLVNLFFLAGYLVIGSDNASAHSLAQFIYNI